MYRNLRWKTQSFLDHVGRISCSLSLRRSGTPTMLALLQWSSRLMPTLIRAKHGFSTSPRLRAGVRFLWANHVLKEYWSVVFQMLCWGGSLRTVKRGRLIQSEVEEQRLSLYCTILKVDTHTWPYLGHGVNEPREQVIPSSFLYITNLDVNVRRRCVCLYNYAWCGQLDSMLRLRQNRWWSKHLTE